MSIPEYRALVLNAPESTSVEVFKPRPLLSHEVRVQLAAAGICGTDMHYYKDFGNAGFKLLKPVVLGHEASGVVAEVGADVKNLAIGDKVAVTPVMNCGECESCRKGNQNTCTSKKFPGSATTIPHIDGFFREYFEIDSRCCRKLDKTADLARIAFVEPAACALHGVERAGNLIGRRVLITGAGPIGTLAAAFAKINGASEVVITDLTDEALSVAKEMGADAAINVLNTTVDDYIAKHGEFDVSIEASGSTIAYISCIKSVKKQGVVVQLSVLAEKEPSIPMNLIMLKELDLKGSFQFNGEFERALELISSGKLDVMPMLSKKFKFEDAAEAFEYAKDRKKSMKVQFII